MSEKFRIAILTAVIALTSSGSGYLISSMQYAKDVAFREKAFLVERKYDIYTTYMKSVNQSWAAYQTPGGINGDARQLGIDAFEEMRAISKPQVQEKADVLNSYFIKLYPPFEINAEETEKFNTAFIEFKNIANKQFTF